MVPVEFGRALRYGGTVVSSAAPNHLRMVLHDRPVVFAISCRDSLSRKCIGRILPNISMAIRFFDPA